MATATTVDRPESGLPPLADSGLIRLRTLTLIRWVGIAGQLATLLIVHVGLGYQLPLGPALAVVGVSVMLNLAAILQRRTRVRLGDRDAALYLSYDLVQLAVLLFLTGGLHNPFVVLLLAPLTVSASILSRRSTTIITLLTLACVTVLALWHYPLPSGPEGPIRLPPLYFIGLWFAIAVAAMFIAGYVWRVAEETRRLGEAFAASRMALAREQRISALGALAAAAAHELGTPLGTIALVAKELENELPPDSDVQADAALLSSEADRCRHILAELSRRPETSGGEPFERLTLQALIDAAGEAHRRPEIALDIITVPLDGSRPPWARRTPELLHGLGNLLQNAQQFARRRVTVRAEWSRDEVLVTIADDGPGFPAAVLDRLGEPYLSVTGQRRADSGGHMGLGIFIAATLLERGGARLAFSNLGRRGAQVAVRWNRHMFETGGETGRASDERCDPGRDSAAAGPRRRPQLADR